MAGTIFISPGNVWTLGSHGLKPIVERIRAGYPSTLDVQEEAIFSEFDAFDFITLEELSSNQFIHFVQIAEKQLSQLLTDDSVPPEWRATVADCWNDLLNRLRHDPRYQKSFA